MEVGFENVVNVVKECFVGFGLKMDFLREVVKWKVNNGGDEEQDIEKGGDNEKVDVNKVVKDGENEKGTDGVTGEVKDGKARKLNGRKMKDGKKKKGKGKGKGRGRGESGSSEKEKDVEEEKKSEEVEDKQLEEDDEEKEEEAEEEEEDAEHKEEEAEDKKKGDDKDEKMEEAGAYGDAPSDVRSSNIDADGVSLDHHLSKKDNKKKKEKGWD